MLNVLVFASYFTPGFKGGGPIKTIGNLINCTSDEVNFKLVTGDRDLGDQAPYESVDIGRWNKIGRAQAFYAKNSWTGYVDILRILFRCEFDLLYLNSFFSMKFSFFPLCIARLLRKSVILVPRGELSEGALSLKKTKKSIFIALYRLLGFHYAVVFQASSSFEEQDIRRALGPKVQVQIAENIGSQDYAESIPDRTEGPLRAVFLSRISPKKNLLSALVMLGDVSKTMHYHIYGPVEDGAYWDQCLSAIRKLPDHIKVEHKGTLNPENVVSTLSQYDLFFFPTKGENYGHVIAEALCAGVPLLISDQTPWRDLENKGLGWDLPLNNTHEFSAVIDRFASMTAEERFEFRKRILSWAKIRFSQRDAIEANISMFKKVCKTN